MGPTNEALGGVRVLDLATLFPAPYLAAMLADFGADVVKVEPPAGDPLRGATAAAWAVANRNKRSVRLDAATESGRALLQQLTAATDVVVLNQPRSVLEGWGCTYEEIAARNPRAIVVMVSGFGVDGPYAERAGSGTLAEAFAGLTHLIGDPDGPPVLPGVPLGDTLTALVGLSGTLTALCARAMGAAEGQLVDVSMYESVLPVLATTLAMWESGTPPPSRVGTTARGPFATSDGRWLALSVGTDAQRSRLATLVGDDGVGDWIASRPAVDAVDALREARVPASEVQDFAQMTEDVQVRHRASVIDVAQQGVGSVRLPSPAPRLSVTPGRITGGGPELGADTETVCREWLACTTEELERWRRERAI